MTITYDRKHLILFSETTKIESTVNTLKVHFFPKVDIPGHNVISGNK